MERRAQFSILFTDEELFDNFIMYQKQQKTLKPLVLKLLTAYYYNEDVRGLIDGDDEESESISSAQEEAMTYFEQCRQSLALMNVYAEGLEDLTDDSIDKFGEFANDVATKTGGKASTETEFGQSVPQIEMISARKEETSNAASNSANNVSRSDEYKELENRIDYLTDLVLSLTNNMSGVSVQNQMVQPESTPKEETETLELESQVGITQAEEQEEISIPTVEVQEEVVKNDEVEESSPEVHEEEIDNGFDDLLASAGISF